MEKKGRKLSNGDKKNLITELISGILNQPVLGVVGKGHGATLVPPFCFSLVPVLQKHRIRG